MSLLSPIYLLTLLALLPLAAFYLLKVRLQRKTVTALFLYQQIFTEKRTTRLWRRMRDLLSLLMLALAVSLLAFGLSRPSFSADSRRDMLLLIDHSASMSAMDGGVTRLELAREAARGIVRALDGSQQAAIASLADTVSWQAYLTDNPHALLEGIDAVSPTERPLHCDQIVALAQEGAEEQQRRVIFISDGSGADFALPANVELLKVGSKLENVGIVAADMRVLNDTDLQLLIQVASTFPDEREVELTLEHDGVMAKLISLTVTPGINLAHVESFPGEAGRWRVRLQVDDALAIDNQAFLVAEPPRPITVRVAAKDAYFFEHSVQAFDQAGGVLQLVAGDADVVIARGSAPDDAPRSIVFQPAGSEAGSELDAVIPRARIEAHPAFRFIDVESLDFPGARDVSAPPDSIVMVASQTGQPLIWQTNKASHTEITINLDPALGEFFFRVQFPVLVHDLITYLVSRTETLAATYPTGGTAPIPGADSKLVAQVTHPDGQVHAVEQNRTEPFETCGFYELQTGSDHWWTAASLLSPDESRLWDDQIADSLQPIAHGNPPAYWLITVALVLILLESVLYHRRKVG